MDDTGPYRIPMVVSRTRGTHPVEPTARPDSGHDERRPQLHQSPVVWVCVTVFLVHLGINFILKRQEALLPSGILLLLENLMAAVACLWRAHHSQGTSKLRWILIGIAELIHLAAGVTTGLEMVVFHLPHYGTSPSDFLIFMWGAPLLLALGSPTESRPSPVFYLLDGVQITLMMVMASVAVFGSLPFQHGSFPILPGVVTVWVYVIENVVIAVFAGLRLRTHLPDREQRAFFASLFCMMALYAVLGPVYNFPNVLLSYPPIKLQGLLSVHQLAMVLLATRLPAWHGFAERSASDHTLAIALDNGSPIVFSVTVVLTAVALLGSHIRLGAAAILCSLAAYGVRSTIVQMQYLKVQAKMVDAQKQLERMSLIDPLTEIPNRRTFDRALEDAWQHFREASKPFALLLIDVDHFKLLNDTLGHSEGDRSLRAVAQALHSILRENDLLARIGGEEFGAILRDTSATAAEDIAREMSSSVAALTLPNNTPIGNIVTVSVGLTDSSGVRSTAEMFALADDALYRAKREGRNRTISRQR